MTIDRERVARWEQALASDDRDAVVGATTELAATDDDDARALLIGALAGRTAPLASEALAAHGATAVAALVAAIDDPARRAGAIVALSRIGDPAAVPRLRALTTDPSPLVRVAVVIGLYRCGDRDAALISEWAPREGDAVVLGYLAAVGGGVAIDLRARSNFDAQAAEASTAPEVRASCAWAVAAHDAARGAELAALLDPAAREVLANVVARRGGPLRDQVSGGDPAADRVAENLGLPARGAA